MSQALEGLRVLELGIGPVPGVTGMILADFGAEVMSIVAPTPGPLQRLPASPMWSRGKSHLALDLKNASDHAQFDSLCTAADVLLTNWRPGALRRLQLDYQALHARHPHLVYAHVTGFGSRGKLADVPGYEHAVAAYAGRMLQFAGITSRSGPVWSAVQVGVHAAIQSITSGILAALYQRGSDGPGRLIETSLLQGMLPYEMGAMIGYQFPDAFQNMMPALQITPEAPPPSLYYHPAQAGDGRWMQFGNLLPHLFDNFLIATDLLDVLADPAFDAKQMLLRPEEKQEAFRRRMLERIQERPSAEWMERFIEDGGIVATTYQSTQQALADPDVTANGHVIPLPGGGVQLGPLARLSETPAMPGETYTSGNGSQDSSHDHAKDRANAWLAQPRTSPHSASVRDSDLPLHGVRVVELATIIAAPLAGSFLADMGADVIKVEQLGGDPFRSMLAGLGAARVNAGKRSISINLKTDQGRDAVLKLLADADIVIHNYRPGVPERLGIGYEQVRALNPGIIYLQSNGYGPDGPGAHRPSTHPIPGAAMGGVVHQMGGKLPEKLQGFPELRAWTSRLMRANELNPDPNTALVVATSAMLGLSAKMRTGKGQRIIVDMFGANAYANADDFLNYPGKAARATPDEQLHGLSPCYRLYPCRSGQWVYLAMTTDEERRRFIDALHSAGHTPPSLDCLRAEDADTADALASLFVQQDADTWEGICTAAQVACVRADRAVPGQFWLNDPQSSSMHFITPAEHPTLGRYHRHGPMVQFDGRTSALQGPPMAGQHNLELLRSCGYTVDEIDTLLHDGIIWAEAAGD